MRYELKTRKNITVADWLQCQRGLIDTVAAFAGITPEEAKTIPASAFAAMLDTCQNELENVTPTDPYRIEIDGVDYSLVPDLMDFEAGAMIDLTEAGDLPEDADYEAKRKAHIAIMSALFRPVTKRIGKRVEVEKYTGEQREQLLKMPLAYLRGAEVFFSRIVSAYHTSTLTSSKRAVRRLKTLLSRSSVGSPRS
jgi:hypothetical protein